VANGVTITPLTGVTVSPVKTTEPTSTAAITIEAVQSPDLGELPQEVGHAPSAPPKTTEPNSTTAAIASKGLTSGKLAEQLGITRSTVEGWESKGRTPPTHKFKRGGRKGETIAIPPYSCTDKKWYAAD
jgi:hypothetical protein